jgi:branched-subunit amino acid aminotransferase/4-amino-4-deoxychorismate lyase
MSGGAVWLNGDFVERDEAKVSAFDAAVQHAVGLFETMHSVGGEVWRLDRHLERLIDSARILGLSESLKFNPLRETVRRVVEKAGLERGRVRLTITGGDLNMLASSGHGPHDPTVLIVAQPATAYPAEMLGKGVMATIADGRANPLDPFAGHKTLNYWPRLRALQQASSAGAGETIFLQVTNHLAGGAVSNLFLVKNGALLTPIARGEEEAGALAAPVLPGITRQAVIDAAEAIGVGCARRMLSVEDLLEADEAFLTNTSWGVLPVVQIEKVLIGEGAPGELTRRLREAIDEERASL